MLRSAECFNVFRDVSLFVGANVRKQLNDGTANADYLPISLQSIPRVLFPTAKIARAGNSKNDIDIDQLGCVWKGNGAATTSGSLRKYGADIDHEVSLTFAGAGAGVSLDLAVISVSPPDARGYVSLGTSVDVAHSALMAAKKIVAQINFNVPRVFGDGFIHISQFDTIVQVDEKLPELIQRAGGSSHAAADKIGRMLASTLISDRATLQMGMLCNCKGNA
jgi:acyl-CoA hydrolase